MVGREEKKKGGLGMEESRVCDKRGCGEASFISIAQSLTDPTRILFWSEVRIYSHSVPAYILRSNYIATVPNYLVT